MPWLPRPQNVFRELEPGDCARIGAGNDATAPSTNRKGKRGFSGM